MNSRMMRITLAIFASAFMVCGLCAVKTTARLTQDSELKSVETGETLVSVAKGEELVIISWGDECYASFGEYEGFISSDVLSAPVTVESYSEPFLGKINADGVNLRLRPDTESTIIIVLKRGQDILIYEKCDGYYKVGIEQQIGYVVSCYCDTPNDKTGDSQTRQGDRGGAPKPPKPDEMPTLKMGASGGQVLKLQKALVALGYGSCDISGNYGARTRDAVRAFENDNNLPADGSADAEVLSLLFKNAQVQ